MLLEIIHLFIDENLVQFIYNATKNDFPSIVLDISPLRCVNQEMYPFTSSAQKSAFMMELKLVFEKLDLKMEP